MHTLFKRGSCALVLYGLASWAQAQVLFACEPEWAALAQVLMPQARVHIATLPTQDPHHIEARPALIAQMRSADMALCTGAALEEGWLPVLQQKSGNPKVQNGQPGMFWATEGQTLLGRVKSSGSPFEGDVHPQGNPHVQANPQRLAQVARDLARRMATLWPDQAAAVQDRLHLPGLMPMHPSPGPQGGSGARLGHCQVDEHDLTLQHLATQRRQSQQACEQGQSRPKEPLGGPIHWDHDPPLFKSVSI